MLVEKCRPTLASLQDIIFGQSVPYQKVDLPFTDITVPKSMHFRKGVRLGPQQPMYAGFKGSNVFCEIPVALPTGQYMGAIEWGQ